MLVGCGSKGPQGEQGIPGNDGISISSITKTGSNGLVDIYTITFSDGNTQIFEVTNGKDGVSAYELYCQEHPEYEGSLEEWLELFYKKDETDYTKYDDFLFTEVTYKGQLGYAANYIGVSDIINFPETFKNLPVLLATIEDSPFAPCHDADDELTALEVIRFPSTVKVLSISDSLENRYDTSQVNAYFEDSIDRFDASFYPCNIYFSGESLETYRATNLRKYFAFSNVYVKSSDKYEQVVNGSDNATTFVNTYVMNEGGICDQIFDVLGGTKELMRFGSFELQFPLKYTVNYDDYDIELPLNFVDFYGDLKKSSGITFKNNLLKGDATQYNKIANIITLNIDLGIPSWPSLDSVVFKLYKEPKNIKVGETSLLVYSAQQNVFANEETNFAAGKAEVVVCFSDDTTITKIPLKCKNKMEIEIDNDYSTTSIIFKEEGTFNIAIDLNTFELFLMPKNFNKEVSDEIVKYFCYDNGLVLKDDDGNRAVVLERKELSLPATRQIECSGIKYDVDLTYQIKARNCVIDADTDHPIIYYNFNEDTSKQGFIDIPVEIKYLIGESYETGNAFIRGYTTIYVKVFNFLSNPKLGLNMHFDEGQTKSKNLMFDLGGLGESRRVYRLNEVNIDCEKFALTINDNEVIYKLAKDSKGEIKDNYYEIESGLYNLTLDIDNQTLYIEEATGELIESVKAGFFKHLKEEGFNVYVRDSDYIVLFDSVRERTVDHEFEFTDEDSRCIDVVCKIKEADYCTVTENFIEEDEKQVNKDCELKLNFSFNGFEDNNSENRFVVSFKSEAYFLDVDNVLFHCVYRKCPTSVDDFHFEDAEPTETIIENNVFYLNGVYLNWSTYHLYLRHFHPEYSNPPKIISGDGAAFNLSYDLKLSVPNEALGHYYNFVFDFNNFTVIVINSDMTYA